MKLIVGLGNPGRLYEQTRHNIGSLIVKNLAADLKLEFKRENFISAKVAKGKISEKDIILCLPLTYMNLSGEAVAPLVKKYKIKLADILVVCDDLDLEFGALRLRQRGSSAGHRGIASIIRHLDSDNFTRLRLGVGRPHSKKIISDFVLSKFSKSQVKEIKGSIDRAVECLEYWIVQGTEKSMNKFNKG